MFKWQDVRFAHWGRAGLETGRGDLAGDVATQRWG